MISFFFGFIYTAVIFFLGFFAAILLFKKAVKESLK